MYKTLQTEETSTVEEYKQTHTYTHTHMHIHAHTHARTHAHHTHKHTHTHTILDDFRELSSLIELGKQTC